METVQFVGSDLLREALLRNEVTESWIGQMEVHGPLAFWNVRHDVLVGLEAIGVEEDVRLFRSDSDQDPFAIDPFEPVYGAALPILEIERNSHEKRRQYSLYARDRIILDQHWRLLVGARFDHIDQTGRDVVIAQRFDAAVGELNPRISVVYDSQAGLVTYASYSQSIDPNEGLRPDGTALSPTLGKAVEGGMRWIAPDSRTTLDVALYGVLQDNVAVDAPGQPGFELQTAKQEHVGLDVELESKPSDAWFLQARYNWIKTRITNDPFIPDGTAALNTPTHRVGVLAMYHADLARPDDFDVGVALNYIGRRQASLDPEEIGLELSGYVRIDTFARWRLSNHLDISINLENLSGENYIQGSQSDAFSLSPGAPFRMRGEIRLRF